MAKKREGDEISEDEQLKLEGMKKKGNTDKKRKVRKWVLGKLEVNSN